MMTTMPGKIGGGFKCSLRPSKTTSFWIRELTAERLLLRLFHEEAVAIERVIPLSKFCRCSREKVENVLLAFGAAELSDMRDDNGKIVVTCEFCATRYMFSLDELRARS